MSEFQAPEGFPKLGEDYEVFTMPYFSVPTVTTVACKRQGCTFKTGKNPSEQSALAQYMRHWRSKHRNGQR